ncbi:hypothetical protein C8R43DRAFT_1133978 [Mycena crocata]|nr:hypothetical protein C8R43DRAFT_1133978 [Mycena crocata]
MPSIGTSCGRLDNSITPSHQQMPPDATLIDTGPTSLRQAKSLSERPPTQSLPPPTLSLHTAMTDTSRTDATTTPSPAQELAAVVAQVASVTKLAVDLAQLCIQLHDQIPAAVASNIAAGLIPLAPSLWKSQRARLLNSRPFSLLALARRRRGTWSALDASPVSIPLRTTPTLQVNGVPRQFRIKKSGRAEALAFYRAKYGNHEVVKLRKLPPAPTTTAGAPGAPGAPGAAAAN